MSSSSYSLEQLSSNSHRRPYRRIADDEKQNLIHQVFHNKLSISKASRKLGINNSTAKVLIRKYKLELRKNKKQHKTEIIVENHSASIQQHINSTNENEVSAPMFYFMTAAPAMGWNLNYPFTYPAPYFSIIPKFD